ncbi:MAG: hypothetical protein P4L92_12935 [Rudaea sp.]|nr:hypothetical protein [Rudaea sp.]
MLMGHRFRIWGSRFGSFALLSGLGWIVDFATFNGLVMLNVRLFFANLVGAAAGMGTVFGAGRLSLFRSSRNPLLYATGLYTVWTVFAVVFASALIDVLGSALHAPAIQPMLIATLRTVPGRLPVNVAISTIAKLVITPLTMLLNFCAMTLINGHRNPDPPAPSTDADQDSGLCTDVQLCKAGGPSRPPV